MPSNHVTLSTDSRTMTATAPDGEVATFRSAQREGFSPAQVQLAHAGTPRSRVGQKARIWRWQFRGRELWVHVNTGPPTWWVPRLSATATTIEASMLAGWLQVAVAVAITVSAPRQHRAGTRS